MPRYKPRLVRCPHEDCPGKKGWYSQLPPLRGPKQCPYCHNYLPGFKRGPRKKRAKMPELNSPAMPMEMDVKIDQEG